MHAEMMYNLLEQHLESMEKNEVRGYLTSKKINYKSIGDSSSIEFAYTFASAIVVAVSDIPLWGKFLLFCLWSAIGMIVVIQKTRRNPKFYSEIISEIEKEFCDKYGGNQ